MKTLVAAVLAVLVLAVGWSTALADGGVGWVDVREFSPDQWDAVARAYQYAEFYGLRDADRDLLLRVLYRETAFCRDITGDHDSVLGRDLSIGCAQWREGGVWLSTPCYQEFGYGGRWIREQDVRCMAWAFGRGMQSHWSPHLTVRWLVVVPSDPRPWLWGGPSPPAP